MWIYGLVFAVGIAAGAAVVRMVGRRLNMTAGAAALSGFGWQASVVSGPELDQQVHPEDRDPVLAVIKRASVHGES